ncbi:369_t:CDS:2 [Diversispora eburnea]|uniref:369_t:CDS:1 n=1 Tax=Diversispora eburnea TaxID=1213867 RepID=A0A9N8Z393_9GLOM|nr:369_t:CDS:2 [Diversispora eburnea]
MKEIPSEIYLLIIEIGEFTIADLKELTFVCHQWARVTLPLIWQTRKFIENESLKTFKNILKNDKTFLPYGRYITRLQIEELDKNPPIFIDDSQISSHNSHDGLCEIMRLGNSLLAIRIMLNSVTLIDFTSSYIVELFGKYCPNLRNFDIEHFQCEPVSKSAISVMLKNFQGSALQADETMENLRRLSILKINGISDLSFLSKFPNIEYLFIGDFSQINDYSFVNIGKSLITKLELVKTPTITDKALLILSSMPTLVKFYIRDRLQNVTEKGWLSFVNRPEGCSSWVKLKIDDGRQINSKFFMMLDKNHPKLKRVSIRGLNYNLHSEEIMNSLKFSEAWQFYKSNSHLHWPIRIESRKFRMKYVQKDVYRELKNN